MQRKRAIPVWLLIPFLGVAGAVGAFATGFVAPQWPLTWSMLSSGKPVTKEAATIAELRQKADADRQDAKSAAPSVAPQSASLSQPNRIAASAGTALSPAATANFGIDIARIASGGPGDMSVIAGSAKPLARITVMADGVPIGTTLADEAGDWVLMTPHIFSSRDPKLEVRLGDLMGPKIAALPEVGVASSAPRASAASVTRDMMRRLERLTSEASGPSPANSATTPAAASASVEPAASEAQQRAGASPQSDTALPASGVAVASANPGQSPSASSQESARENLPVPVQFVYRMATFTPEGEAAAALLLKYFKARQFREVALSGHADERGSSAANMQLSRERLERVQRFLQDGGFTGQLTLVPKGSSENFTGVDRSKFPIEELYQLDRRVEVISAR